MTPDERKAWLDSLGPYDQVVYIRSARSASGPTLTETRAEVVDILADCIVLRLLWFDPAAIGGGFARESRFVSRAGEWCSESSTARIEPMTDEARRRFGDSDRRAWIEHNISIGLNNLGRDDLRRFAGLLGYQGGDK